MKNGWLEMSSAPNNVIVLVTDGTEVGEAVLGSGDRWSVYDDPESRFDGRCLLKGWQHMPAAAVK